MARSPEQSLRHHALVLLRHPTPWVVVPWFLAALGVRIAMGRWTWRDLAIPVVIVALQPFTEWVIHVTLLHFRPRIVMGRRVDLHVAREHRRHHLDPKDVALTLVPLPELLALVVGVTVVAWPVAIDHRDALTVMATVAAVLGTYEWTHYLIHSGYRPRSRHARSIFRSHRLHHFRNEHYWMGVTSNLADRVLGTFPQKLDVPLSDTARTLGIDQPS
ncbi:MAG: sterol desaturase family protein [Acidimicrobiales bacterium]